MDKIKLLFLKKSGFASDGDDKKGKMIIQYHRSYRKLPGSVWSILLQFCLFVLPLSLIIVIFYPAITRGLSLLTKDILSPFFFPDTIKLVEAPYIDFIGTVSFLDLPGRFPSTIFSLVNALLCLVVLVIFPYINQAKPIVIFVLINASIHFVASLFFLFIPTFFPYDAGDYSRLYMLQQISIWFFVPLICGIGVMPLPASLFSKCATMITTYCYSLIFGAVRYVVFLFILTKISLLYMAILFFALGPLIDFVYVVGIYSSYVTRLAIKIQRNYSLWQW